VGSVPLWLFDLIIYFIGVVIVVVIVAWLRAMWRERDAEPRTHGQGTEGR